MIASEACNMVRFKTGRDSSGHIQDTSLYPELQLETRNLRNWLAEQVPSAFRNETDLTPESDGTIIMPSDYRKMIWLNRLVSGSGTTARYEEVPRANPLRPQDGAGICWDETEFHFRLALYPPDQAVLSTYRSAYVSVSGVDINDANDTVDVPDGFEQVVVYRVCTTVCIRTHDEEKAAYFTGLVDGNPAAGQPGLLEKLTRALRRRGGNHARPGFTATRGYYRSRGGIP